MKTSVERILTTHTGSLPRPRPLLDLIAAREQGKEVDSRELEKRTAEAVEETVAKQIATGHRRGERRRNE